MNNIIPVLKILTGLSIVVMVQFANGQENKLNYSKNAVYAELFGQGILYSVNYDHRFTQHISLRAGFSSWGIPGFFFLIDGKFKYTSFPVMANYLTGKGSRHLELGVGVMPATVSLEGNQIFWGEEINEHKTMVLGTATIGYRSQPEGGLLFRIGLTPVFSLHAAVLTGGLSLGVAF